jgi:O-acetyl-ADP-ribose deacetylase (regulator of RNase III)
VFAPVVDRCRFCGLPQPWATERRSGAERGDLRAWLPPDADEQREDHKVRANDPASLLYASDDRDSLWIIEGDVALLEVDAVISNDDVDGRMWSQVARSIKNGAGEGVERLAQEGKPFPLGHAWWTTAGGLRQMKEIIHVASMSRRGKSDLKIVRKSLVGALNLAEERGHRSLGVAAIGSGPSTIDPNAWYRMFAEVVVEHFSVRAAAEEEAPPSLDIVLALFEPSDFDREVQKMGAAVARAWRRAGRPRDGTVEWEPPSGRLGLIPRGRFALSR